MIRILNFIAIAALIGSAIYAYSIKYQTILHAEQIAGLKAEIKKEQDQIGLLRADWGRLTRPERIQALAEKLLPLQPMALNQIVQVEQLPEKAKQSDQIGHKLEDLGLGVSTATPGDRATDSATPSATSPTATKKAKR